MPPPPITIATILAGDRFRIFWRYVDIMGGLSGRQDAQRCQNQGCWLCYFRICFGYLKVISFEDGLALNLRIIMHDRCTWETVPVETVVWTSNYLYIGTV